MNEQRPNQQSSQCHLPSTQDSYRPNTSTIEANSQSNGWYVWSMGSEAELRHRRCPLILPNIPSWSDTRITGQCVWGQEIAWNVLGTEAGVPHSIDTHGCLGPLDRPVEARTSLNDSKPPVQGRLESQLPLRWLVWCDLRPGKASHAMSESSVGASSNMGICWKTTVWDGTSFISLWLWKRQWDKTYHVQVSAILFPLFGPSPLETNSPTLWQI